MTRGKHVAGLLKSPAEQFCAELYDDVPFGLCRFFPDSNRGAVLNLQPGVTEWGVIIHEHSGNSKTDLRVCRMGAFPQIAGLAQKEPAYPLKGTRGTLCTEPVAEEKHKEFHEAAFIEPLGPLRESWQDSIDLDHLRHS